MEQLTKENIDMLLRRLGNVGSSNGFEMRTLKKLTEEEKKQLNWWGDYGIVKDGKVEFQGTYEVCLQWLSSGN